MGNAEGILLRPRFRLRNLVLLFEAVISGACFLVGGYAFYDVCCRALNTKDRWMNYSIGMLAMIIALPFGVAVLWSLRTRRPFWMSQLPVLLVLGFLGFQVFLGYQRAVSMADRTDHSLYPQR